MRQGALAAAAVLGACTATIPDGQIVCTVASPDCPEGFTCCASGTGGMYDGVCTIRACGAADAATPDDAGFDGGIVIDAGPPPPPVPEEVAAGGSHSCLRLTDGAVHCWGSNQSGQLGQGVESSTAQTTPIAVMNLAPGALEIEASIDATCARFADRVQCWGSNQVPFFTYGPIGSDVERSPLPRDVMLTVSSPTQLVMGAYHACAIVGAGRTLECWGHNADGQLGTGTRRSEAVPVAVPGLAGIRDVCAGAQHTCAALDDGTLHCWGGAARGQLGIGEPGAMTIRDVPTLVALDDVVDVECGYLHTCAITDDGLTRQTFCWGENRVGETQQDEMESVILTPTAFRDASGAAVEQISIGGGFQFITVTHGFTLVRGTTLPLSAFGSNADGQLGLGGRPPPFTSIPTRVLELTDAVLDFDAGSFHACAIDETGSARRVLCWGAGANGRLGNANDEPADRPVTVFGFGGT